MIWYRFSDSRSKHNEILKLIAIISMVIDHIGYIFFPQFTILRIIGRIAFPIFAFQIAKGYIHTSNRKKYMVRLWMFALISQIPYTLLFETINLNILFTLLLSVLLIDRIHKKEWYWIPFFTFIVLLPHFAPIPSFDYSLYGILTPLIFYLFYEKKHIALVLQSISTIVFVFLDMIMDIQIFAILGFIICLYFPIDKWKVYLNKYFFYWFYPGHLVVLLLVKLWILFFILQ